MWTKLKMTVTCLEQQHVPKKANTTNSNGKNFLDGSPKQQSIRQRNEREHGSSTGSFLLEKSLIITSRSETGLPV